MQTKWIDPSTLCEASKATDATEKIGKLSRAHLARGHFEVFVLNGSQPGGMTVDADVVRRISEDHRGIGIPHQEPRMWAH